MKQLHYTVYPAVKLRNLEDNTILKKVYLDEEENRHYFYSSKKDKNLDVRSYIIKNNSGKLGLINKEGKVVINHDIFHLLALKLIATSPLKASKAVASYENYFYHLPKIIWINIQRFLVKDKNIYESIPKFLIISRLEKLEKAGRLIEEEKRRRLALLEPKKKQKNNFYHIFRNVDMVSRLNEAEKEGRLTQEEKIIRLNLWEQQKLEALEEKKKEEGRYKDYNYEYRLYWIEKDPVIVDLPEESKEDEIQIGPIGKRWKINRRKQKNKLATLEPKKEEYFNDKDKDNNYEFRLYWIEKDPENPVILDRLEESKEEFKEK